MSWLEKVHQLPTGLSCKLTISPYLFAINFNVSNIVLKDSGDVDLRKLVLAEDNKKASLPTSSIPHNHQLLTNGCHSCRLRKEDKITRRALDQVRPSKLWFSRTNS